MNFRFLFARSFVVRISVPWLDSDRFVERSFYNAKRTSSERLPNVEITNFPLSSGNCALMAKPDNYVALKNTKSCTKGRISLVSGKDSAVISDLIKLGYSVTTVYDSSAEYIITSQEKQEFANFVGSNFTFLEKERPLFVESKLWNPCITKRSVKYVSFIKNVFPAMLFIILLRLYVCNFVSLNIQIANDNFFGIWFMTAHGHNLTPMNKKLLKREPRIKKEIDSFVHSKKDDKIDTVSGIVLSASSSSFFGYKIIYKQVFRGIYMVIVLKIDVKNHEMSYNTKLSGSVLRIDDKDSPECIDAEVSFQNGRYPIINYNFNIDGNPCQIEITSNSTENIPFGMQSLEVFRMNCIHNAVFEEGMKIPQSFESFVEFMKLVYERLDYKCACVFSIDSGILSTIVRNVVPDLSSCVDDIVNEFVQLSAKQNFKGVKKFNYKQYRVGMHMMAVDNTSYLVIFGMLASTSIIRSSETNVHAILSMIISYHHKILKNKEIVSPLGRMSALWEKSNTFALVECIGTPTNFMSSTGSLFGKEIGQEEIDYVLDHSLVELDWKKQSQDGQSITQLVVPFWIGHEKCWIVISGYKFNNPMRQKSVYTYFIEDITKHFANSLTNNDELMTSLLCSLMLGLHRVTDDMRIEFRDAAAADLCGEVPPVLFTSLTRQSDKATVSKYTKEYQPIIRTFTRFGRPIYASTIPSEGGGFYFFRQYAFEKAIPVIVSHLSAMPSHEQQQDTRLSFIDIKNEKFFDVRMDNHLDVIGNVTSFNKEKKVKHFDWTPPEPIETKNAIIEKLESIASLFYRQDGNLFLSKISDAFRYGQTSFTAKLADIRTFRLFIVNIQLSNNILSIFLMNIDATNRKCNRASAASQAMDAMSPYAHIFIWTFEDSDTPDCIFSNQPYGQTPARFNWTTVKRNVLTFYQKALSKQLKSGKVDMVAQLKFEETKWYIIRGLRTDSGFNGICMQLPNDSISDDIKSSPKIEQLHNLEKKVHEFGKLCNVDVSNFDDNMKTLIEDQF